MTIPELLPLLEKVETLRGRPWAADVLTYVEDVVHRANSPSMAQSACDKVIAMCNPKAWGDIYVEEAGWAWPAWHRFLDEMSAVATQCGQAIFDHRAGGG